MNKLYLVSGLFAFLLGGCVPQAFEQADYRNHLTVAEKQDLARGQVVNKIHTSYWRFHPQQLYWQGPMRVEPLANGKFKFRPYGHWVQYDERGGLLCESDYFLCAGMTGAKSQMFYPAGHLQAVVESKPLLVNGDSVLAVQYIQFKDGVETDTAYVEKCLFKNDKRFGPLTRYADAQGKHVLSIRK